MSRKTRHLEGWAALLAVVVIADVTGEITMSAGFTNLSRHKILGPPLILTWAVLTAHLFGLLPPRYDPIHNFFGALRQICIRTIPGSESAFDSMV